jgi:hypothetical protein
MHNLAMFYSAAGRKAEELALDEEVLALRRKVLGPDHPDTLKTMGNLAGSLSDAGRVEEAIELQAEVVAGYGRVLGPEHPHTLSATGNLSVGHRRAGRLPEAVTLQEQALATMRRVLPTTHRDLAIALGNLAELYEMTGREREAAALRQELAALQPKPLSDASVVATLVPPDAEWKWLHPTDGSDPAAVDSDFHSTFFSPSYDDASWKTGRDSAEPAGGFGYGLSFDGVDIGFPEVAAHRRTAWFRHRFRTDAAHSRLELRCQRDDGIVVYLDGREVVRDNMPAGPDAARLFAVVPQDTDNDGVVHRFALPGPLEPGEHVLAISLHNAPPPSSDLRIGGVTLVETGPAAGPEADPAPSQRASAPE